MKERKKESVKKKKGQKKKEERERRNNGHSELSASLNQKHSIGANERNEIRPTRGGCPLKRFEKKGKEKSKQRLTSFLFSAPKDSFPLLLRWKKSSQANKIKGLHLFL